MTQDMLSQLDGTPALIAAGAWAGPLFANTLGVDCRRSGMVHAGKHRSYWIQNACTFVYIKICSVRPKMPDIYRDGAHRRHSSQLFKESP
jgi:hypothetical protein